MKKERMVFRVAQRKFEGTEVFDPSEVDCALYF